MPLCLRVFLNDKCHVFSGKTRGWAVYTNMTVPDIIFIPSAFNHGVTEADIRWAFKTAEYDSPLEGDENKHLLIGFNTSANLLEILYNELNDGRVRVFHAMPCRNKYIPLLNQQEDL